MTGACDTKRCLTFNSSSVAALFVSRNVLIRFLVPNAETLATLDEIRQAGAFHAALRWSLTRKRAKRSESARQGGLWYWLELSMAKWVSRIDLPLTLVPALSELGWTTPMDLVLRSNRLDPATAVLPLSFAGRGVFVYECHQARQAIENEAALVLQMFFRRLMRVMRRAKSFKALEKVTATRLPEHVNYSSVISDIRTTISGDTVLEQQIVAHVLECLETLVDDVVAGIRLERKEDEERIRWQEIPVRTEKRQATVQAVGMLQQLMAHKIV